MGFRKYGLIAAILIFAVCAQLPCFNHVQAAPLSPAALSLRAEMAPMIAAAAEPAVAPQQLAGTSYTAFDSAFAAPLLAIGSTASSAAYTAGYINANGSAQAITAGTITSLTASKTDCSPAGVIAGSCDIIYWPGSGASLSFSTSIKTAGAWGNVIVGYATESAAGVVTAINPASMNLPLSSPIVYNCGSSGACAGTGQAAISVIATGLALTNGSATVTGLPALTYDACSVVVTSNTTTLLGTPFCHVDATTLTVSIPGITGALNVSYTLHGH